MLTAIDIVTKSVAISSNMSAWSPSPRFVVAIVPAPAKNGLIIIARCVGSAAEDLFLVEDPQGSASVSHVGSVACSDCSD